MILFNYQYFKTKIFVIQTIIKADHLIMKIGISKCSKLFTIVIKRLKVHS